MKKHVVATILVLLLFSLLLGSVYISRKGNRKDERSFRAELTKDEPESAKGELHETETTTEATKEELPVIEAQETEKETEDDLENDFTMMFTGDVLFANSFRNCYDAGGIGAVVSEALLAEMTQADFTMVNEEFPFSTRGAPMEDKQYTFRANPAYVSALLEMGVDLVSLANNHILDYGKDALTDTFATLDEAGIAYVGAGATKERAMMPHFVENGGNKFGFLSASRVIPVAEWNVDNDQPGVFTTYDGSALCDAVAEAKKECNFVTVFVHWGVEYEAYPVDYQKTLARQYIDAGADLVIGAHTHCLQGIEFYNGKPIFYSLGNFIFGSEIDRTMALRVSVSKNGEARYVLIPAKASGGLTVKSEGSEAGGIFQYVEEISQGIIVNDTGEVSEAF